MLRFSTTIVIYRWKVLVISLFLLIPPFLFDVAPGLLLSPGLFIYSLVPPCLKVTKNSIIIRERVIPNGMARESYFD
jgi:hypothetical protein